MKKFGGNNFIIESAGLEAGMLNPIAVEAMKEDGIDISKNRTKDVNDFFSEGRRYDYVITVCDEVNAARCPVFPGLHKKISWSFPDPSTFNGTHQEKLNQVRTIRDIIKKAVQELISEIKAKSSPT